MQGIGKFGRWRLLGFVAVIAAILSLAAIACSDDDDASVDDAQAVLCGDLESLDASLQALANLSSDSTVDDLKSARDDVGTAMDDVRSSAEDVQDAKVDELDSAYSELDNAITDVDDEATLSEALAELQPELDAVDAAWDEAFTSAACLAAPTGEATPGATEPSETSEPGVAGSMDITAVEFAFEGLPSTQPGGLTTISLNNIGVEDHQAMFLKLNDGATFEQFQSALQADETGVQALTLASGGGGVNVQPPGESGQVVYDLTEGSYVALCFVSGADDIPHLAKGMIASFEVTPSEETPAEIPAPDSTITAADFSFPDTALATGEQTVQVVNSGAQNHEFTIVKLNEGVTIDQVRAMFATPDEEPTPLPGETPTDEPPFTSAGGFGALAPGEDGYMILDLEPGNYALLCFFPDPNQGGAPHAALGMVGSLTVQ